MQKLANIKIGGLNYTVQYVKGLAESGSTDFTTQHILVGDELSVDNQLSTLLHEVIEVINNNYDLQLKHQTIQTLEVALYAFLKDNNII